MCAHIDWYIEAFSKLKADNSKHKPLLLLAVLDLIAANKLNREFIEPDPDLVEAYTSYCRQKMEDDYPDMAEPFYEMAEEPFWDLAPRPGVTATNEKIHSLEKLKELYLGARLDPELFKLCLMEPLRKRLQNALKITYHI